MPSNNRIFKLPDGHEVMAHYPEIISASRRTDIPAFYADWFFHRLKAGYSCWRNPFNGAKAIICYEDAKFIVFWSKNPYNLLEKLDYLDKRAIGCLIQYTLNDYEKEDFEPNIPALDTRIDTFKRLVDRLGTGAVVWRFDPLFHTPQTGPDELLARIEKIGDQLLGYTEKLVFSFIDIYNYKKVLNKLKKANLSFVDWTVDDMRYVASQLVIMNRANKWNYELATCGESIDLKEIGHNSCIDGKLIARFAKDQDWPDGRLRHSIQEARLDLPRVFKADPYANAATAHSDKNLDEISITAGSRDNGQRTACRCLKSKDIGEYNTCAHGCVYCYANSSSNRAQKNYLRHRQNDFGASILDI